MLGHDVEVRPVEKNLAKELERLALGDVVVGEDESGQRGEELGSKSEKEYLHSKVGRTRS